jgi:hypothetical protein
MLYRLSLYHIENAVFRAAINCGDWGEIMNEDQASSVSLVKNSDAVLSVYGYWPDFHDAEVVKFCLQLSKKGDQHTADVIIAVHHWGQDNPKYVRSGPDCIIEFSCRNISNANIQVDELNNGGWIDEICIVEKNDDLLMFDIRPLSGFDICFDCEAIEIVGIYPYLSDTA